ncbi:alpha/beta fold hydrolase [Aquipuribacter sp. MA13-6]|uniref:alpha/beta fold hydrolase n=1 Tax=unclassified Aquipuribacter TaxID=2635084 RepID=UPI003EECEAE0
MSSDVFYTDRGRPGGPAVLLVHGIGMSGRSLERLVRELSTSHRVLTPDLRGFGASPRSHPAATIEEHAVDLERLVDRAGLDRPLLLGHSMGCQVVTEMAARRPGRTHGVVLVGPVAEPGAASALHQGWRLARDASLEPPWLNALTMREYLRAGPRSYSQTLVHMLDYPIKGRLAQVTAPVDVVRGSHDPIASREFVEALARAAPRGRAHEVPHARHLIVATRPDVVAEVCRRSGS